MTGRSSAFPITEKIVNALGLSSPRKFKDFEQNADDEKLVLKSCDRLIQFPENGEWLRSDSLAVSIGGPTQAAWYLNGKPMALEYGQMRLPNAGSHKITARLDGCRETNEIFLDFQKN